MSSALITLLAAVCGGVIARSLKIPAGGLIGSMLAVGILQVNQVEVRLPVNLRLIGEIFIGGTIGLSFTSSFIKNLKSLLIPAVFIMIAVVAFGVVVGLIMYKVTNLDIVTSIFASSPGGITNMTVIANSLGADSKVVTVMQLVRLISLVFLLPIITKLLTKLGY